MDIVERLRHGHTRYAAETHQEATIRRIKAMDEAADEIERLRERDKKLTKAVNAFLDEWDDGGPSCQTIRAIIEPEDSE